MPSPEDIMWQMMQEEMRQRAIEQADVPIQSTEGPVDIASSLLGGGLMAKQLLGRGGRAASRALAGQADESMPPLPPPGPPQAPPPSRHQLETVHSGYVPPAQRSYAPDLPPLEMDPSLPGGPGPSTHPPEFELGLVMSPPSRAPTMPSIPSNVRAQSSLPPLERAPEVPLREAITKPEAIENLVRREMDPSMAVPRPRPKRVMWNPNWPPYREAGPMDQTIPGPKHVTIPPSTPPSSLPGAQIGPRDIAAQRQSLPPAPGTSDLPPLEMQRGAPGGPGPISDPERGLQNELAHLRGLEYAGPMNWPTWPKPSR